MRRIAVAAAVIGLVFAITGVVQVTRDAGGGRSKADTRAGQPEPLESASRSALAPLNPMRVFSRISDGPSRPANAYRHLRARGKALRVLRAARAQLGVEYVYGAGPRDPAGLAAIGMRRHRGGFDCSTFVAYAFQVGLGEWISGRVAHTDEIWTQGGLLPLTSTPGETAKVVRGTGARPPRGGYRPGDILLTRWGAGGYWGHVVIVSERGRVIQSLTTDVYETDEITRFLAEGRKLGWVRVKSLA